MCAVSGRNAWPLAIGSLALMGALVLPVFALRLNPSDAGNDPANTSTRHASTCWPAASAAASTGPC